MVHRTTIRVHLMMIHANRVLLGRRTATSGEDGSWHAPAGHLERGESVLAGMAREAKEELGIVIAEKDLNLVQTLHLCDAEDGQGRLQLFFQPQRYEGKAANAEQHKCAELRFWPLDALPVPIVPCTAVALAAIQGGRSLSVAGWQG
ncbi:NUDIX domain-containing protein [Streptomyces sp. SID13666]|uniref:NUDIX hydrolase n=1 Tax=unclassified Streptomyces TaxID=2593676 RepID=UPI0013C203D7|nr:MULTISPECIES: NUDIX domain-containing protein [unclassified Streptomyces]NEA56622.1 NUDIX domain-containing protein [Streptomyces sp. SID13666]NEA73066.1 NUDIX domain-containing protein [Streptomyces sp. SID13588]